jgi:hypothetical protein
MFNLRRAAACSLMILVITVLPGCSGGETNVNAKPMSVEIGMSRGQVVSIAGEPARKETYGGTEFLIYLIGTGPLDILPVAIVDGRVTGIGRNLYDNVVRSKAKSDLEDNMPRKRPN